MSVCIKRINLFATGIDRQGRGECFSLVNGYVYDEQPYALSNHVVYELIYHPARASNVACMNPAQAFAKLSESITIYDEDFGLTKEELYDLGLQPWSKEPDTEKELWLFPLSFYEHIPAGFPLVFIDWRRGEFMPHQTDKDTRFGVLAYGVLGRVKV